MTYTDEQLTQQAIISLLNCNCAMNGLTITYPPDAVRPTDEAIAAEKVRLAEALNFKELRKQRNRLLAATDYLALSDVTMSDEMKTYRQALRDLPANTSDPANPTWPTKPGG